MLRFQTPSVEPCSDSGLEATPHALWDLALVSMAAVSGALAAHYWSQVDSQSRVTMEMLLIGFILHALCAFLLWNLLFVLTARLVTLPRMPRTLGTLLRGIVERWGTAHARRIVRSYTLRTTATLSIATTLAAPAAFAETLLPQPDLSTISPTSTSFQPHIHPGDRTVDDLGDQRATPASDASTVTPASSNSGPLLLPTPQFAVQVGAVQAGVGQTGHLPTSSSLPSLPQTYTVEEGDCLWDIAQRLTGTQDTAALALATQRLYQDNAETIGDNPHLIHPGTTLSVPHTIKDLP